MPGCCVIQCKNSTVKGFRVFRLPSANANNERRLLWLKLIDREDLPENAKICEVRYL